MRFPSTKDKNDPYPVGSTTTPALSQTFLRLNQLGTTGPNPVLDGATRWKPRELVLGGAFSMLLKPIPIRFSRNKPEQMEKAKAEVKITFGDVSMTLVESGALMVSIGKSNPTTTKVQLVDIKGSDRPPQNVSPADGVPYMVTIYPVWNGIVVSSGVMDGEGGKGISQTGATFCPKTQGAYSMKEPYVNPAFDPQNPVDIVEIGYAGHSEVIVDLGTDILLETKNCRLDWLYDPCFFSKKVKFDLIFVGNKTGDADEIQYIQKFYPIWSKGGNGDAVLKINGSTDPDDWIAKPLPASLGGPIEYPDSGESMEYRCLTVEIDMGEDTANTYSRYAPELLGFYVRYTQTDNTGKIDNPNSVPGDPYKLSWTGGTHGDPTYTGSWQDYIQSINISQGLDGSSATIVLDKYGCAGWDATAIQKIGAITIDMSGGPFSARGGRVFSGLAYGVGSSNSPDSNTWTIQCYGLEKKLSEIILILPPFFDGMTVNDCTKFLCRYGGVYRKFDNFGTPDQNTVNLGGSSRPDAPKYNFSAGTSVIDALNSTMNDSLVTWVCQPDGKMYFYSLDESTGLPKIPHDDHSADYPYASITTLDETPDFEDLRNEIVVSALRQIESSTGMMPDSAPVMPFLRPVSNRDITPKIPWSRMMFKPFQGILSDEQLTIAIDRLKASSSRYEIVGRTQITGDARIWPYSQWGTGVVVSSVSHNIDFTSKTWTTDLEFSKSGH
jgi:hypothetical protein